MGAVRFSVWMVSERLFPVGFSRRLILRGGLIFGRFRFCFCFLGGGEDNFYLKSRFCNG
jgi:hypothetical protein